MSTRIFGILRVTGIAVTALSVAFVWAQESNSQSGAKALFVDSLSGAEIQASGGGANRPAPARGHQPAKQQPAAATTHSAGLMYWVELMRPSGEAIRVTSEHVFHSGDRIRVHLTGSVDGDVAVYQRDPRGLAVQLFPDMRINGGSATVRKGSSTAIPSESSWFRFDDEIGSERLLVVLTPQSQPAVNAPPPPTSVAAADTNRDYDHLRPSGGGSKGLVLETDATSAEPATYVVRSVKPLDPISIEIVLKHER